MRPEVLKFRIAASKLLISILICEQENNEIPTAIPMLSGFRYPIRTVAMLYDQMGRKTEGENPRWQPQSSNT